MFRRLIIEDWTAIFTIAAFVTVASIYLTMLYRTLRMRRPQIDHLSNLPFEDDQPVAAVKPAASRHE
jgi:ABC-type nickel/cobalt efflux system permease component RcnA